MNQQDKAFMTAFSAVLGVLVVIAILCFIIASSVASSGLVRDEEAAKLALTKRIAPVGRIVMAGSAEAKAEAEAAEKAAAEAAKADAEKLASAGDMSGEAVYNASCNACHGTKVPNAPQLGDKEQWQARFDKGLDQLVSSAINGINTMPPKGGNSALSDQNIKDAVVYMLNQSGFEVATESVESAGEQTEQQSEEKPQAEAETKSAQTEEKPADNSDQTAVAAVEHDLVQGKTVYDQACNVCHGTNFPNAPQLGNKEQWQPRVEQGFDTLVDHAINGFKTMIAKGGRADLSDEQVTDAVAYMLDSVK